MATQMDWSHDFCLSCDRQIAEGAYCSQACRLADLEKAGHNDHASSNLSSSASSTSSSHHGFYLPPAYNFSAAKSPSTSRGFDLGAPSPRYYSNATYHSHSNSTTSTTYGYNPPQRSLTPSSSRSSLSSNASQSASGISLQAANQLSGYVRSFDQVRDTKRRLRSI